MIPSFQNELSEYEKMRAANIKRNNEELSRLGLNTSPKQKKKKKRSSDLRSKHVLLKKRQRNLRSVPVAAERTKRRSLRIKGINAGIKRSNSTGITAKETGLQHWAEMFLQQGAGLASKDHLQWDRKRTHQHLTVSTDGAIVCTTGCAGYGASLAVRLKSQRDFTYEVEVLREGVGGFAVGVASNQLSRSFKSLGNSSMAWVLHSRGELLHNRKVLSKTTGFGVGDRLKISISKSNMLSFCCNGKPLPDCKTIELGQKCYCYTLAVQPFMGGVARFL